MDASAEKGTVEFELGGEYFKLGYEIARLREYEFDLTVWYHGKPLRERARQYSFNPHNDVVAHARRLLEIHLKAESSARG